MLGFAWQPHSPPFSVTSMRTSTLAVTIFSVWSVQRALSNQTVFCVYLRVTFTLSVSCTCGTGEPVSKFFLAFTRGGCAPCTEEAQVLMTLFLVADENSPGFDLQKQNLFLLQCCTRRKDPLQKNKIWILLAMCNFPQSRKRFFSEVVCHRNPFL